jgi:hypothetical protein
MAENYDRTKSHSTLVSVCCYVLLCVTRGAHCRQGEKWHRLCERLIKHCDPGHGRLVLRVELSDVQQATFLRDSRGLAAMLSLRTQRRTGTTSRCETKHVTHRA